MLHLTISYHFASSTDQYTTHFVENLVVNISLFVYGHLRNISSIGWDHLVSNNDHRPRVLGKNSKSIGEVMNLNRLRWLGHIPHSQPPPRCPMTACVWVGWKKARSGQTKTWHHSMKSLTFGLGREHRCR